MNTEYVFRTDDEQEFGIDAQTAGSELDRIRRRDGTIEAAVVVDEARPEEAPLHPAFEWRDPVAAEQWRKHQAQNLIKVVRVVPAVATTKPMASVRPLGSTVAPPVERHCPVSREMQEAVGLVVETRRRIEDLKLRAQRSMDRMTMIALNVAFCALEEAHEALTAGQRASTWEKDPVKTK